MMYKFDLNDYNEYYYNKQLQPHEIELSHEDFVGCPAEEIISKLTAEGYTFDDCHGTMLFHTLDKSMNSFQMWFNENNICTDYEGIW